MMRDKAARGPRLLLLACAVCLLAAALRAGGGGTARMAAHGADTAPALELPFLLPARWDSREQGRTPAVKSQGSYGTCWALAAATALEASLLPGESREFSADHMALQNRFGASLSEGGDYVMVMAYLSGWQGPVTEEEDPYGDAWSPDGLRPSVHVQEIRLLEGCTREEIKEAVLRYGAVQTSLNMTRSDIAPDRLCYQGVNAAWYDPEEEIPNHDVVILGWDDSYSRFRFARIPPEDGAFLCQNSWGEDFGAGGTFYVSYADANIARTGLAYSRIEGTDNYDFLYQADDCGWLGQQGYASETCWFANVYRVGEEYRTDVQARADQAQELAAVGFYATGPDTSYELYLVHDFEDADSFSRMELLQKGKLEQAGYYTVDLADREALDPGERFAAVVRITTPGAKNPVAVEYRSNPEVEITTGGKEGYLSQKGERWENTEGRFGSNVCLKAYVCAADLQ